MTPNTYELAKRVEKIAPELGIETYTDSADQGCVRFKPNGQWFVCKSKIGTWLLLGVLQEWADGEGYVVQAEWDSPEDGVEGWVWWRWGYNPGGERDGGDSRLEALVLCLEHSKARDSEPISGDT